MRSKLLLLVLLFTQYIYTQTIAQLSLGDALHEIHLEKLNDSKVFTFPKEFKESGEQSIVFQIFSLPDKSFNKISVQLGSFETVEAVDGEQSTQVFRNSTNRACTMKNPNQKCLWYSSISKVTAVNFTCVQAPCQAGIKAYVQTPKLVTGQKDEEKLEYIQDLLVVKFNFKAEYAQRTVIENRLSQSLSSKANSTTVQYFLPQNTSIQNSTIQGDVVYTYIQLRQDETYKEVTFYAVYSGKPGSEITIKGQTFTVYSSLELNRQYTDYFQKEQFSTNLVYRLDLKDYDEYDYIKFKFKWIELKQGEVTIYGSCLRTDALINTFWTSTYQQSIDTDKKDEDSKTNKQYSLIISQGTAQKIYGNDRSTYYFGLQSNVDSGYFKFEIVSGRKKYPSIVMNEIISGKSKGDIINIMLSSLRSDEEYLKIDLKNVVGNAVISLRECKSSDCIQEAFTQENKDKMESRTSRLEENYMTKSIQFMPNCSNQDSEQCYYMLALIPDTTYTVDTQYQIEVFTNSHNNQVVLRENQVFENKITMNDYQYYALYLDKTSDIKTITIKTSSPHVQIYASIENECMQPNTECPEGEILFKGLNTRPIVITKKDTQRGVVYVGIYGYTSTIYSVVAEVDRVDQTLITQVQSGSIYYGQLSKEKKKHYFVFNPSSQVSEKDKSKYDVDDIEINIRGAKDKIVIMVNNDDSMPYEGQNGFMWSSNNGILFISKNDPNFKKNAVYNICVMATEHAFQLLPTLTETIQSSNELQYQLTITSDAHTKILELGSTMIDQLEPKDKKLYQIHITNLGMNYVISTHSNDHKDKDLKIDMKIGSAPYDENESYEINYSFSQSQYFLKHEDIDKKFCKGKDSCDIFIAVQSKMDLFISYSLTIWNKQYAIELKEGTQYQDGINLIDGHSNFYYYPSNKDHPLNIFSSSLFGHTGFNVLIFDNSAKLPSLKWPFPNSSKPEDVAKYHFTSGIHNSHSITFQTQAFDSCWPNCVVLISLSSYQGLPLDGSDHSNDDTFIVTDDLDENRYNDKFTILLSTLYSDLHFNQHLEFTLENQESRFFYLSLNNIINEKDSIQFEMTSLSGNAVIGAMIKDDTHNRYPSVSSSVHDFVSYSNNLEISFKKLSTLMKKQNISATANPVLIVEVTCISMSAGKFVLVAMQGNSPVIDLMHGLPTDFYLKPKKLKYYKYFHFSDSDFSIRVSREIGFPDLSLRVCKKSKTSSHKEFTNCLQNVQPSIDDLHAAGESSSVIFVSRNDTKLYCQGCLYVIGLSVDEQETEVHGFINVLLQQDFTWLQEGRQIVDTVDNKALNLYRISVDSDEETHISLHQYSGDIEFYYSYRYSYILSDYIGPFKVNPADKFIHKTLRPRQDYDDDENFNTYNKPNKVPIVNKDSESKQNQDDKGGSSQNAQFDDLSEFFYEAEIFLCVKNVDKRNVAANYTLVYSAGDEYRYIYDGNIMGSSIPPGKKITYLYHHFEYQAPARLNIFSHSKFFSMESHLTVLGYHDLMKHRQDYKDITKDPIPMEQLSAHEHSISYGLPERNGTYELVFLNEHETKTLNLSLSINSRDMLLIPLTYQIEHALTAKSINYYEVIAPKKGHITLSITHCTGEFSLGVSTDYNEFLQRIYDMNFKSYPGSTNVYSFKVNQGPVFFAVMSSIEESFYKIRPDFFTLEKQIPHNSIVAGNEGVIYHKRKVGGQTDITFTPIRCATCTSEILSKSRVQYDILYSTDVEILNVLGKCSATNYFEHEAKNQLHFKNSINAKDILQSENLKQKSVFFDLKYNEDIKYTINLDDDAQLYHLSVVATITNIPNKDLKDMKIFYENSQIGKVQVFVQGEASVYAFLFACILIMVFFCMTTCLFWRRYKSMQQGLEVAHKWRDVEMQQEKRKQIAEQSLDQSSNDLGIISTANNTKRESNLDDSFADKPFENPDLYQPSDHDLKSHFKSEAPQQEAPKQESSSNPFQKIFIKPPSQKPTKSGYDEFVDEN